MGINAKGPVAGLALYFVYGILLPLAVQAQALTYPPGSRGSTPEATQSAPPAPVAGMQGSADPGDTLVSTPYPGDLRMWNRLLGGEEVYHEARGAQGIVLPHHLADPDEIAATWRTLGEASWDLVVLLSPDHYLAGPDHITLPRSARFTTVYGDVPLESRLAARLAGAAWGARKQVDGVFPQEHGISVHTTFIRRFLPDTPFLPLLIKPGTPATQLDSLARDLARWAPRRTLFVASVDASHYNPVALSRFHDQMTVAALEGMDGDRLLRCEVDSPESLRTLNTIMTLRGNRDAKVFLRTDLQDRFGHPIADNTSHLYVRYRPGAPEQKPTPRLTLLALPWAAPTSGLPRSVLDRWTWDWRDPERTSRHYPALAPLVGIGEEDRRLWGSDLYVIAPGDGRPYRRTISGIRVSVVHGFSAPAVSARRLARERAWAEVLIVVADGGEDAILWGSLAQAADVLIVRDPTAERLLFDQAGVVPRVVLPGTLLPSGEGPARPGSGAALVWTPGRWDLEPWPLEWDGGLPVYGSLPSAKSYDPAPEYHDRE